MEGMSTMPDPAVPPTPPVPLAALLAREDLLQPQPRVHHGGLARADAEELGVEARDVVEITTVGGRVVGHAR